MDPENIKKNPGPQTTGAQTSPSIADDTLSGLHDAGVDISARISEDNEFSSTPGEQTEAVTISEPLPVAGAEKIELEETMSVQKSAPAVSVTPEAPIAPKIPVAPIQPISSTPPNMYSATMNSATVKPTPQPFIPTPKQPLTQNNPSIKQLRTFKTDAEEAVRYQNVSKVNIAVAEHKKKEEANLIQYESGPKKSLSPIIIVILLLLVIGGAGAGGYYWFFMRTSSPVDSISPVLSAKTIIPYDKISTVALTLDGSPMSEISQNLTQTDVQIGQIHAVVPLPVGTTTMSAPLSTIFKDTSMPDRLNRSLGSDYMIGTYLFNQNGPFIILKNTFFQNAFAGMLEWEKNMRNDLISVIRVNHPTEQPITANSDIFGDIVVSNIDARVLYNTENNPILIYAFADKDTIVIATNIDTLKYVLNSLLSVRVVQ